VIELKSNENNFTNFAKKIQDMVAVNEGAYTANYIKKILSSTDTTEEIITIIESGAVDQIVTLSDKFIGTSGLYKRIISYFATFLTNDIFITPKKTTTKTIKANKYLENYRAAVFFGDTIVNPKLNFPRIVFKMLAYGAYYGLFLEQSETEIVFKDLPVQYCRSRFKTHKNVNVLEFDMSYFDTITDVKLRELALAEFPKEFSKGYAAYKKDMTNMRWFSVLPEIGVAFYYQDQNRPYFISMLPNVSNLKDYRALEKSLDKQELERILVQKIPVDKEGDFLLSIDEAAELHHGVVNMLQNNERTDVLTTFAEVDMISVGDKTKADRDNLEKIERSVYKEAGVSQLLFSSDSASSITMSIANDMSLALDMSEQLVNWLSYQLNLRFGENNKYYFEASMLPVSHYNRKEAIEMYLKLAEFGYSKMLVSIASGLKQSSFLDLVELENDILGLAEKMIPLQSAHTATGDAASPSGGSAGRPTKAVDQKADKTIANQESA
jgi:hypothetical protein